MPARTDIRTILVLGSGPIVIGQAGEFDYSGTQACHALREDGFRVVLVNSNPATIMTDPGVADRTYIESLDLETVSAIIAKERPDALLPTLGGQTALNLAVELFEAGVLDQYGVELIGADVDVIRRAEDREVFRACMHEAGIPVLDGRIVSSLAEATTAAEALGFPLILRPAFTMGGEGGGSAATPEELARMAERAITASPIGQVLVERSIAGWGEFEFEVVRDRNDNAIIVCSIENIDPMGVHTGDSVTVAPAMTLTDTELQRMRDVAIAVVRAVGVETGGANVQFALERSTGELVVIEMNPRVSRSSALASKATGFPIAKIAARLAIGYTLDELPNDVTGVTPASFEPALDYVALKMPRFAFEKVPAVVPVLSTYMQSVGEVLTLGRSFGEAFGKALRARELDVPAEVPDSLSAALACLATPRPDRYDVMLWACDAGATAGELASASRVDPWFCDQIVQFAEARRAVRRNLVELTADDVRSAHRAGLTDRDIAAATETTEVEVIAQRHRLEVRPSVHAVDTCAGEFAAASPYFYTAYETETEAPSPSGKVIVVLGSGPNRIGQGVEFDYCCVQAVQAARDLGYEAVMINCNPETVSTDQGVSDRLYLEPVTLETVIEVAAIERPVGVITQLGGQTPLRLAEAIAQAGIPLIGTPPHAIDLAEDRGRFGALLHGLGLRSPEWRVAPSATEVGAATEAIGFPVLIRPSYVLGGRAMAICHSAADVDEYLTRERPQGAVFVDRFLERAVEVDVDALCDGQSTWIAGIMEHVEAAGIHSGDSACVLPAQSLGPATIDAIGAQVGAIARAVGVVGLVNVQFAVVNEAIFVIEANPRASRTVPFVSKATGVPLVRHAVRLMLGESIADLDLPEPRPGGYVAVKEAVLPFSRFPSTDPVLGPEMRATGEVMAIRGSFAQAFAAAQRAAGQRLPRSGSVFVSARDADKPDAVSIAGALGRAGFRLLATEGTGRALGAAGLQVEVVRRVSEGADNVVDRIAAGGVDLVINTPGGRSAHDDGAQIRRAALRYGVPCATTIEAARASVQAILSGGGSPARPLAIQDVHRAVSTSR